MGRPAKPKSKPAEEKRVRFTFEPRGNTAHGMVFEWIIHKAFDGKAKVGLAVRAFWLPFACRDRTQHSEAELREIAQQSIRHLEDQIQLIRESFGLEIVSHSLPSTASVETVQSSPENTQTTSDASGDEPTESQFLKGIDINIDEGMLGDFGDFMG